MRLTDAEDALKKAEKSKSDAQDAVDCAQGEVDAQEQKVKDAQKALDDAKAALDNPGGYDAARDNYNKAVADKEQALADQKEAADKLAAAESELAKAKGAVTAAQEAVDEVEEAKKQTAAIVEDKQDVYDTASEALLAAVSGNEQVSKALEKLNAAKQELTAAKDAEAKTKAAYDEAEADVSEAQRKADKAAEDHREAEEASQEKAKELKDAEAARKAASDGLESAKAEHSDALSKFEEACDNYNEAASILETARKVVVNLTTEVSNLKTELQNATNAYNEAKEEAIASSEDYAKGAAGFYESIGATDAGNIVTKLAGVNSANAKKYFGDQFDADGSVIDESPLNLENMKLSLEILEQLNELRKGDGLHELKVDTNLMAFSQVAAMWAQHYSNGGWGDTSSGVNSSNIHSVASGNNLSENAAWNGTDGEAGVTQAMDQWYTLEKAVYESDDAADFRAELERLYSEVESVVVDGRRLQTKGNWNNCVYVVSKYDMFHDIYKATGHYLNVVNPSYQYMGAAYADSTSYTQWNTYEQTFDFSGNGKFDNGKIYTVDGFIAAFNKYYDSVMNNTGVDLSGLQSEMKAAQKKYDERNEILSAERKHRDQAQKDHAAAEGAKDALEGAYNAAMREIIPYREAYNVANVAYETANDEAEEASKKAEGLLEAKDSAEKTLATEKQERDEELRKYKAAQGTTSSKQDIVDNAQDAYDKVVAESGVSDEEFKKLQDAFNTASKELEDAKTKDTNAANEVSKANSGLTSAKSEQAAAQGDVDDATEEKSAADDEASKANQTVTDAENALKSYEDVTAAEDKLTEAQKNKDDSDKKLTDAQAKLDEAEDDVTEASQEVTDAKAHKDKIDATDWDEIVAEGSTDPEYADVIEAADAVDTANGALDDAKDALDTASDAADTANEAFTDAQEAYDDAEQAVDDAQSVVDAIEGVHGGGTTGDDDSIDDEVDVDGLLDRFTDIDAEEWYVKSVDWAVKNGVMNGYKGMTSFGPNDVLTREQAAAVLYNYLAEGAAGYDSSGMPDVSDDWYTEAVNWAVANGIMNGYDSGEFGVGDALTREQFCAIIANAVGADLEGIDESALGAFPDAGGASEWARRAIAWAVESGVIHGAELEDGSRALQAGRAISRSEMAAMMMSAEASGVLGR